MSDRDVKPDNVCGDCGRPPAHGTTTIAMRPGHDGKPWWLCGGCWRDGVKPTKLGAMVVTPAKPRRDDEHTSSLRFTGGATYVPDVVLE